MKIQIAILGLCLLMVGCNSQDNSETVEKQLVGKILSAKTAPIEYSDQRWVDIQTDQMIVCISPKEPVLVGVNAYIVKKKSGKTYFGWDGGQWLYSMK